MGNGTNIIEEEGPTLRHKVMKTLSQLDLVLCMTHSKTLFALCQIKEEEKPVHTDHFSIAYSLSLPTNASIIQGQVSFNFRATDWERFGEELQTQLLNQDLTNPIWDKGELDLAVQKLTDTIQSTIQLYAKHNKPRSNAKRWWNDDVMEWH